jgi:hypothetical protein
MKKAQVIFFAIGLMVAFHSNAQISFENAYDGTIYQSKIEVKGNIYYSIDSYNNECKIYNLDHSIWKTIGISAPPNNYVYDIQFVSQHLFNEDDLVELVVIFYEYVYGNDSTWYFDFTTKVINENGDELLTVEDGAYPYVFNDEPGSKLLVYIYDYSFNLYPIETFVYHLPGKLLNSSNPLSFNDGLLMDPYPNPSRFYITIPYSLDDGISKADLVIYDMNGREIDTYEIDHKFNNIKINTKSYKSGTYAYCLKAPGYKSQIKKFVIE